MAAYGWSDDVAEVGSSIFNRKLRVSDPRRAAGAAVSASQAGEATNEAPPLYANICEEGPPWLIKPQSH